MSSGCLIPAGQNTVLYHIVTVLQQVGRKVVLVTVIVFILTVSSEIQQPLEHLIYLYLYLNSVGDLHSQLL